MPRPPRARPRCARLAALLFLLVPGLLQPAPPAWAHDIPGEIVITGFVKPEEDGRLHLVVRVPLTLLLNVDLPKRGPGYLDLARIDDDAARAGAVIARQIRVFEDGEPLQPARIETRIALPSDRSFASYDTALAAIQGPPLDEATNVFWNQGFFDAHLEYPIRSAASGFSLRADVAPGLGDRLHLVVRYLAPGGAVRAFDVRGGIAEIMLDPRWYQAASLFLGQGVAHILEGTDHLLFLLLLVLPFRRRVLGLVGVVTAFTLGHSVTLIAAALGYAPAGAWFPPVVETVIALSIVYMAIENVVGANLDRRWYLAAGFGLIHGFGFAYTLTEVLQFAGSHLLTSLLFFNLGIEVGQVLALVVAVPVLNLLFRQPAFARYGAIVISVLGGHEAWHWMVERAGAIRLADLPVPDAAAAFTAFVWLATAVFVGIALSAVLRPWLRHAASLRRCPDDEARPS